jgi:hypothetical protein
MMSLNSMPLPVPVVPRSIHALPAGEAGDEAGEPQRDGLPRLPACFVGDVQGRDRQRRFVKDVALTAGPRRCCLR